MAVFKRVKLFTNITQFDLNNMMLEQMWAWKLESGVDGEAGTSKTGRYRIRYSKTDQSFMFADSGMSEADVASFEEAMGTHGPAISCEVSQWTEKGWVKCLDWLGEADMDPYDVCDEMNNQFRSFITGKPMEKVFYSTSSGPTSPKKTGKKKPINDDLSEPITPAKNSRDDNSGDFDWV